MEITNIERRQILEMYKSNYINESKIMGRNVTINDDGTLSIQQDKTTKLKKIRFTTKLGDINVAEINQEGDEFVIKSKKGISKTIDKEVVNQIFSFVDTGSPNIIKGGVFEPDLILKFV